MTEIDIKKLNDVMVSENETSSFFSCRSNNFFFQIELEDDNTLFLADAYNVVNGNCISMDEDDANYPLDLSVFDQGIDRASSQQFQNKINEEYDNNQSFIHRTTESNYLLSQGNFLIR